MQAEPTRESLRPARLRASDEVLERALHGAGIRTLASELLCFFQEHHTKHKICTFHVYIVSRLHGTVNADAGVTADDTHRPDSVFLIARRCRYSP